MTSKKTKKAASRESRDLTAGLIAAAREVEARALELAERVRESEALARVQERGAEVAERARERAEEVAERAGGAAERAKERSAEAAAEAAGRARRGGDQALERVGDWLVESGAAERMGVERRRRRTPARLALLVFVGLGVGYLVAKLTGRNRQDFEDEFTASADRLAATPPPPGPLDQPLAGDPLAPATLGGEEAGVSVLTDEVDGTSGSAVGKPLAERVRARLDTDPRTSGLPDLVVNVADATVFIRGSVRSGADRDAIRQVVVAVPGVVDVDLEVITSA